ncbi:MAG: stage II sporulation protein M [bacterium]|nr:stage II sporulation protein M [bacterium]
MIGIIAGVITSFAKPDLLKVILDGFQEKFGSDPALDINLVMQIFSQNVIASLIAVFGGLLLGLGSILVVVVNGFLIGFVITSIFSLSQDHLGISLAFVLGGTLPHGIFELPAFLIASALGLRLGLEWIGRGVKGERGQVFKDNLKKSLLALPAIALILLIAAIIEVFVSGKIVANF